MKTPDEIKMGLECCGITGNCYACPYYSYCHETLLESNNNHEYMGEIICREALTLIQQREEEKTRLDCTITQLAGTIKHLRETAPRWISVEERLPEENSRVLIIWFGHIFDVKYLRKGNAVTLDRQLLLAGRDFTHWMPLPEPPKE